MVARADATAAAIVMLTRLRQSPAWRVGQQFLSFGLVGLVGYVVDVVVLRLGLLAGLGLYSARVPSFVAAASTTWWLNRRFTFRASAAGPHGAEARPQAAGRQWAVFVVAMLPGMALNYGTYAVLVTQVAVCARWPELAVFAGALAGMGANFVVSKYYIFKG
jgi:putative flippase GtrA